MSNHLIDFLASPFRKQFHYAATNPYCQVTCCSQQQLLLCRKIYCFLFNSIFQIKHKNHKMASTKAKKRKFWHPDLLRDESSSNDSTSSTTFQDSNVQLSNPTTSPVHSPQKKNIIKKQSFGILISLEMNPPQMKALLQPHFRIQMCNYQIQLLLQFIHLKKKIS